ncbi:MAG: ABC transporter permease [Nocardioidaceae bacterium]
MTAPAHDTAVLDLSTTPRIPFRALVGVELRKLADTRSGKWLLIAIGAITALIIVIFFFTAPAADRTFLSFVGVTATPQGFLLPVLGILLVTSEWSQRTALTTFTLVPARSRVLAAKVVAALLAGLAAIVLALAVAAVAAALGGAEDAWVGAGTDDLGKFTLLQATGVLQGLAFGLLFLNSAAAIVTFFVLPTAFTIVASLWGPLRDAAPWVDIGTAQQPLFGDNDLTGEQWVQVATTAAIWVVLPFVLGLLRVRRAEVK